MAAVLGKDRTANFDITRGLRDRSWCDAHGQIGSATPMLGRGQVAAPWTD